MRLALFLEGPMSFDGTRVLHSEGEGYYIDSLAQRFEKLVVFGYWWRPGSPWYTSATNYSFKAKNIEFIELPLSENFSFPAKVLQTLRAFWIIGRNNRKFDMMYFFIPGYPSVMALLLNYIFRKPYIAYAASDWSVEESKLIFRWQKGILRHFFNVYASLNLWFERKIVSGAIFTLSASHKCISRYSVYSAAVYKTVARLNWPAIMLYARNDTCLSKPVRLLYVGMLTRRKGIDFLIDALAQLSKKYDLQLVLVGNGDDRQYLFEQVNARGMSEIVMFKGQLPNDKPLMDEYKAADIFVLPSLGEGFPRVLYEAMLHGVPIVTTDVGGVTIEVPDEVRGLIVTPGCAVELANAIERLIVDGDLRRQLIANELEFMRLMLGASDGGAQVQGLLERQGVGDSTGTGMRSVNPVRVVKDKGVS